MGQLELQDFRSELEVVFGERGIDDTHYDRWVNFAYQELCSGVRFQSLLTVYYFNTVVDQYAYPLDFQPLIPINCRDEDQDLGLLWIPVTDGGRLQFKLSGGGWNVGQPTKWTMFGDNIFLWKVPATINRTSLAYIKQPDLLVADDDTTVIPFVWDQNVLYLSIAHGYLMLGEENRAGAWHNKAANSIATKMDEGTVIETEAGLLSAFTAEHGEFGGTPNTR